jgi:sortase A
MMNLSAIPQLGFKRLLRNVEYVCWALGGVMLGWFVLTNLDIFWFQKRQALRWESPQQPIAVQSVSRNGGPIGKISIPRIGLSAIVAEGDDESTLRHAVGHIPGTTSFGRIGNVALAGHRDTFFRPLNRLRLNDRIILETPQGKYEYQVIRTLVVEPQRVDLLQPSAEADLTLITCFPFRFIGPAPQRFVVQALQVPTK